MKNTLLALLLFAGSSHAAITISGTAVTGLRDQTGTNAAAGCLALLIVDTTGNGFLGLGNIAVGTTLTGANDPVVSFAAAGKTIGSTFGGELVLNTMTTSPTGAVSGLLTNVSVADYLGKQFAVVWFEDSTFMRYGIIRGSDWTFPAADSGTFTHSSTDSGGADTYFLVNSNTPAAGALGFRTGAGGNSAAAFGWVPEPSVALLSAVGALGLFRRRRS